MIARSARPAPGGVPLQAGFWVRNKAGLSVSKYYGFGLMDAGQMVYLAEHWNTVPPQQRYEIEGQDKNRFTFSILIFWRVDTQTFNHVISGYVDF